MAAQKDALAQATATMQPGLPHSSVSCHRRPFQVSTLWSRYLATMHQDRLPHDGPDAGFSGSAIFRQVWPSQRSAALSRPFCWPKALQNDGAEQDTVSRPWPGGPPSTRQDRPSQPRASACQLLSEWSVPTAMHHDDRGQDTADSTADPGARLAAARAGPAVTPATASAATTTTAGPIRLPRPQRKEIQPGITASSSRFPAGPRPRRLAAVPVRRASPVPG